MSGDTSARLYPEAVREGSPTTVAVYATLQAADRAMSYAELKAEIGASRRAVKQAVYALRDAGLVESRPDTESTPPVPGRKVHEPAD